MPRIPASVDDRDRAGSESADATGSRDIPDTGPRPGRPVASNALPDENKVILYCGIAPGASSARAAPRPEGKVPPFAEGTCPDIRASVRSVEVSIQQASGNPGPPPYEPPRLVELGSLVELTLGGCSHGKHLGAAGFPFEGGPISNCSA